MEPSFTEGKLGRITFKRSLIAAAALCGASSFQSLQAKQFLVRFSSPSEFNKLQHEMKVAQSRPSIMSTGPVGAQLYASQAILTQTLENLGMGFVEVKSAEDLEVLKKTAGIQVEEDQMIPLPAPLPLSTSRTFSNGPSGKKFSEEAPWGVKAVDAKGAWDQGARGDNVKVAVLDTGIDRDHPDLKNRFLDGKDFVNSTFGGIDDDDFFSFMRNPSFGKIQKLEQKFFNDTVRTSAAPYPYFDQHGHGTHVSGTIAAELDGKGVVGVAPNAKIMMGRVCGRFGCTNFAVLKGINWAIQNKAQVISMSLGGPQDVSSQREALARAEAAGVVAVAATGNDGTNAVSFPGAYSTVIGVGAVEPSLKRASFSQYGPELDVVAPGTEVNSTVPLGSGRASKVSVTLNGNRIETKSTSFSGSPEVPNAMSANLVPAGLGKPADFSTAVRGKFALIQRGEIAFADKVKNAINAGASGVVIYNNADGLISGAVTQDGSLVAVPVVMIEKAIGEQIVASIKGGQSESATLQTLKTDYAEFQGTSMATPHVSGVVALILSKNPAQTPAQVRQALYSTASPGPATSENEYGAGVVNASLAVKAAK